MNTAVRILNGPNLARLGRRQPEVYGTQTYDDLVRMCVATGSELGLAVTVYQSDQEADLLDWVHDAADGGHPVVINAAGLSHTSVVLRDACAELTAPWVEVHISNVHAREPFRAHSYLSALATGVIVGLGTEGYALALRFLAGHPTPR